LTKNFSKIIRRIETERLILRQWREEDATAFYAINNDEKVIKFLRSALTMQECKNFIAKTNCHIEKWGFGLWAVTLKNSDEVIGFVGLNYGTVA